MNYIKRLESTNNAATKRLKAIENELISFRVHLSSSKFWDDTTIQVYDVHRWLDRLSTTLEVEEND